jgi:uncharacterized membrane protein YraQ (UPF0718 family)
MLQDFARLIVYSLLGMQLGTRIADALEFFIYDVIKIFFLLSVIIFMVSIIRSYFPPEKTKRILSHKREFIGNIPAALLMAVTALSLPEMIILRKVIKIPLLVVSFRS